MGQFFDQTYKAFGLFAHRRQRDAEEHREHHDLQDFVVGHRLGEGLGYQVNDEILQGEGGRRQVGVGANIG
ncbi:hypothetical protein D3C80_2122850 [compost metagenome]